jgi:hypothetical protein
MRHSIVMEARVEPKIDLSGCLLAYKETRVRTAFEIVNKNKPSAITTRILMNDIYVRLTTSRELPIVSQPKRVFYSSGRSKKQPRTCKDEALNTRLKILETKKGKENRMNENSKSEWTEGHSHLKCKSKEKGVNKHPRGCQEGHLPQAFLQVVCLLANAPCYEKSNACFKLKNMRQQTFRGWKQGYQAGQLGPTKKQRSLRRWFGSFLKLS